VKPFNNCKSSPFFLLLKRLDYEEKSLIISELITRERSFLIHGNKKQVKSEILSHGFGEVKRSAAADVHMKMFSGKMKFLRKQGVHMNIFRRVNFHKKSRGRQFSRLLALFQ